MTGPVLYHHNISVCAQKVRLALVEKGLSFSERHVSLMRSEHLTPEYRAINPKAVVPAIVHNGAPVIESTIILEYLEDAFPEAPALRPRQPVDRARMRQWTRVPDDGLHVACGTVSYGAIFGKQVVAFHGAEAFLKRIVALPDRARAKRQAEMIDKGIEASFMPEHIRLHANVLKDMEAALADDPYLAGDSYSLAETAILPYVWRLERLGLSPMWADYPRVADWFARCKARPSWDKAMEAYPSLVHSGEDDYDDDLVAMGVDVWPQVSKMLETG
jgi:glutathione S-transferase